MPDRTARDDLKVHDALARELIDQGKLIEAGFHLFLQYSFPPGMPAAQRDELRTAFFSGSQHLMGAIMGALDGGDDPTPADLQRMDQIAAELDAFILDFAQRKMPGGTA